ncbi:MAG TPA: hypothetical protein VLU43_15395 [Anaeromyxobacteraceae bacterium]|nr:hypothetical protein [Anaeromyxobacteraceae bacterium]
MDDAWKQIEVGFQVFANDGGEEFGAVRDVRPEGRAEIVVNVENAGDFHIPLEAVTAVHYGKVILDVRRVPQSVRRAFEHAHDRERPGL